jgi:transcriptional regulator with XRE-family HTH domain
MKPPNFPDRDDSNISASVTTEMVIRELINRRKELGLSHDVVAERTKLHRSTISLIESGKREPTLRSILKIADALNISLKNILQLIENK